MKKLALALCLIGMTYNTFGAGEMSASQSSPLNDEQFLANQSEYVRRLDLSAQILEKSWFMLETFLREYHRKVKKQSFFNEEYIQKLQEISVQFKSNPILILSLAKYFSEGELEKLADFLGTKEANSVFQNMNDKLASTSTNEEIRMDFNAFKAEIRQIFVRLNIYLVKKPVSAETEKDQGKKDLVSENPENLKKSDKSNSAAPKSSIQKSKEDPSNLLLGTQNFTADPREMKKRLGEAYRTLNSFLPLIQEFLKRKLPRTYPTVEGLKISAAITNTLDSFRENPVLVLLLAKHFTSEELNVVAIFLESSQAKSIVDNMSRQFSQTKTNEQFQLDMARGTSEISHLWGKIQEFTQVDRIPLFAFAD